MIIHTTNLPLWAMTLYLHLWKVPALCHYLGLVQAPCILLPDLPTTENMVYGRQIVHLARTSMKVHRLHRGPSREKVSLEAVCSPDTAACRRGKARRKHVVCCCYTAATSLVLGATSTQLQFQPKIQIFDDDTLQLLFRRDIFFYNSLSTVSLRTQSRKKKENIKKKQKKNHDPRLHSSLQSLIAPTLYL
jgi:hypothetical protein